MASVQSHTTPEASKMAPLKVMIIGDSISHGREGDYTWRYRLWGWLQAHTAQAIHFVGPYQGTCPPEKPSPPRPPPLQFDHPPPPNRPSRGGGYALDTQTRFLKPTNSSHASAYGLQVFQAKTFIAEQVRTHQPDVCLVQLGFNDLGWRVTGPGETLRSMKEFVDNARSQKHDIKFAIANVPFRTAIFGFPELPGLTSVYNNLLEKATEQWDNEVSPVRLVRFCENYECGLKTSKASYDGLHPNELGEYQLAQAFSRTLIETPFNWCDESLDIPDSISPRPTPTPSNFKATPAPSGIVITWDHVYGARWYELRARLVSSPPSASPAPCHFDDFGKEKGQEEREWTTFRLSAERHDTMRCLPGQKYEYQVRTCGGDTLHSCWSDVTSATVDHDLQTAPGPKDIVTHATTRGFTISWNPPEGCEDVDIDRYGVWWWETKDGGSRGGFPTAAGVRGTSAEISGPGLVSGRRYGIAVDTWTKYGGGLFAGATPVVVGRGVPPAPAGVEVQVIGQSSVEMRWSGDTDTAAGFKVWVRRLALGSCLTTLFDELLEDGEAEHWAYSRCSETRCKIEGEAAQLYREVTAPREPQIANVRVMKQLVTGLSPSVWGYEFAVSAFNGSDESPLSEWVRAPPTDDDYGMGTCRVQYGAASRLANIGETDSLEIVIELVTNGEDCH